MSIKKLRKRLETTDLRLGEIIATAFDIYRSNFVKFLPIILFIGLPVSLLQFQENLILMLLSLLLNTVPSIFYIAYTHAIIYPDRPQNTSVSHLAQFIAPGIIANLLAFIVAMVGFAALIVPFFWSLTFLQFALMSIVLRKQGPLNAFRYSHQIVSGNGWRVFRITFGFGTIITIPLLVSLFVVDLIIPGLSTILSLFISAFAYIGLTIVFLNLDPS